MKKLSAALAFASFAFPVLVSAVELSLVRGSLESTGVDPDASGTVQSNFSRTNPQLQARLRGLTPGQSYQLSVDGVSQADFAAGDNGRADLRFRLHASDGQQVLDFDPRGHLLAVNDGTDDILSMVFSGEGELDTLAVDERTTLLPVDDSVSGRIDARYLKQRNQTRFILHFHGFDSGAYTVYVDGQPQAEVTVGHGRSKMVVFQANTRAAAKKPVGGSRGNSKRQDLDFDPRGLVIDVVKDGAVLYSGEMLAKVAGVNTAEPATAETTLTSSGADADATATAALNVRSDAAREFSVEVTNLPAGEYTLLTGGIERGTIAVTDDITGAGKLEFSSAPDDGKLLLDFDPSGQSIEIKLDDERYFIGTVNGALMPVSDPATATTTRPLLNQLVDSDASAHFVISSDASGPLTLDVSISNLPAGDYDFVVDHVVKGMLTVMADDELATLNFAAVPDVDQTALDFVLGGVTVGISQGATTLLTRSLP